MMNVKGRYQDAAMLRWERPLYYPPVIPDPTDPKEGNALPFMWSINMDWSESIGTLPFVWSTGMNWN